MRIVAILFAAIGLVEGKVVERPAWPLYRAMLSALIPCESAVQRLIVVAASNLVVKPSPASSKPKRASKARVMSKGRGGVPAD